MPLLSALTEFKYSFGNIANEKDDLQARGAPYDELNVPDTEAVPFEPPGADIPSFDDLGLDTFPGQDDAGPISNGIGDFDFSAFLNTIPGDVTPPSIDDLQNGDAFPEDSLDAAPDDTALGAEADDDFSVPDGLLSGLSDEIEAAPSDFSTPEEGASLPDFDLDDDLGLPDEDAGGESFDSGEDAALPDFDLGGDLGLPDEDAGGESFDSGEDSALPDFDLGGDLGLPDEDAGGESFDSGEDAALPDFDLGGDLGLPDEDAGGESFDSGEDSVLPDFDLGGDLDLDSEDTGGESFDSGQPAVDAEPSQTVDLGGEKRDGSFTLGSVDETPAPSAESADETFDDGLDLGGDSLDTGGDSFDMGEESLDLGGDSFDTGEDSIDLGGEDLGIAGEDAVDDFGFPEAESLDDGGGLPDFDIPLGEESFDSEDSGLGEGAPDSGFDDLGETSLGDDLGIDLDADAGFGGGAEASADDDSFGGVEFDLQGLDDLLDKSKKDTAPKPEPKGRFWQRKKVEKPEAEPDVDEIRLSDNDIENLKKTLSNYPLNLRIACEELIAEQVLAPQQLSKLIRFLINGAPAKESAALAGEILGKTIVIPRSFQKSTGEALEAEQSSFAYIFVHNFLPVLRLFSVIAALAASVFYLGYKFVYTPIKAESLYKRGYERIAAGEYQRANELFDEAFSRHRRKNWFYQYAEGFRDERRYMLAEEKYDELLRYYPRDKKGVLDYAALETYYLMNYDKANRILTRELIDYAPNDREGLLAVGDNNLAWADSDPSRYSDKYEDARFAYARLLEKYGWTPPIVERMMKYFIRTDNLKEVLPLKAWFEGGRKRRLSPPALAELGGYLLDKQLEEVKGVSNPYVESIQGVRAMLLQAVRADLYLPEPHYHLARYYKSLNNFYEEQLTLENAIRAFDLAKDESVRRRLYRVDAHYRYANLLINNKQFFPAEEQVIRGIELYEDFLSRNLITPSPQLGKLYAIRGDLEYFVKTGNMRTALNFYHRSEQNGWAPPEIQYRMGAAYYQLEDWRNSLDYLFRSSADLPLNRRLLFAMGNVAFKRGDYFAAQGYYNRLLDLLENQRNRLPILLPNDSPEFLEVGERLMMTRNNIGVTYEALADQTGNREYRSRALSLYAESARAWDTITRNPQSMVRMRPTDGMNAPGINLGFLNANNALRPAGDYIPQIFIRIDKDAIDPSPWEALAPLGGLTE